MVSDPRACSFTKSDRMMMTIVHSLKTSNDVHSVRSHCMGSSANLQSGFKSIDHEIYMTCDYDDMYKEYQELLLDW